MVSQEGFCSGELIERNWSDLVANWHLGVFDVLAAPLGN
jgi:hypothetical protein